MCAKKLVALVQAATIFGIILAGSLSAGQAQVQGLDTPDRAGCSGGYVEGLGCSRQRPVGPGIQDSDQGWQRDWRDFGAGDPGLSILYGAPIGPEPWPGPPPRPPKFGPMSR
jgi:hypothetical protein